MGANTVQGTRTLVQQSCMDLVKIHTGRENSCPPWFIARRRLPSIERGRPYPQLHQPRSSLFPSGSQSDMVYRLPPQTSKLRSSHLRRHPNLGERLAPSCAPLPVVLSLMSRSAERLRRNPPLSVTDHTSSGLLCKKSFRQIVACLQRVSFSL